MDAQMLKWLDEEADFFLQFSDGMGGLPSFWHHLRNFFKHEHELTYLDLLEQASRGHGCIAGTISHYSLEEDYDIPEEVLGAGYAINSTPDDSVLPFSDYVTIIERVSDVYVSYHPELKNDVLGMVSKIRDRYNLRSNKIKESKGSEPFNKKG